MCWITVGTTYNAETAENAETARVMPSVRTPVANCSTRSACRAGRLVRHVQSRTNDSAGSAYRSSGIGRAGHAAMRRRVEHLSELCELRVDRRAHYRIIVYRPLD